MRIVITGGAGFIGSAVVRHYLASTNHVIINVDKLTYAANLNSLPEAQGNSNYKFEKVDICDRKEVERVFRDHAPDKVMHLAAESHVDRSIDGPDEFIKTNVVGTQVLLDVAVEYWRGLEDDKKSSFRFHHVSTDEVFGSLGEEGLFTETTPYDPSSPYAASKAASDHLVRAWGNTYGLPVVLSNTSNNYGPYQFPEKLIPLIILKAAAGEPLPVYGTGTNVRDWLYVEDHARGLQQVLEQGAIGQSYNIGGHNERGNLEVVEAICDIVDELVPRKGSRRELVTLVKDRPGHDFRYAIDATKIERDLNWAPQETFETGLRKTVEWYLNNRDWAVDAQASYSGQRLGVSV